MSFQAKRDNFFSQQGALVYAVFPFLLLMLAACGSSSSGPKPKPTATATGTSTPTATPTPSAEQVLFSPPSVELNPGTASTFTINMTAFDSSGVPITPSSAIPMMVKVYGAESGVITPATSTLTASSSVTFTYNGGAVPNNVLIDAWIFDVTSTGYAIGQALLLPQNLTCAPGTQTYSAPLTSTVPNALQVQAAVGHLDSTAPATTTAYTVDTGSLGTVVPVVDLPSVGAGTNTFLIGPGAQGLTCYDSNNLAFYGNYYLAPVDIQVADSSIVHSHPIMVLGINQECPVTDCTSLAPNGQCISLTESYCANGQHPSDCLHYIGVGYDRESSAPGDLFQSPAQNAFLHITDPNNEGTDIGPGYILPSPPTGGNGAVTLGINSTTGYNTNTLTRNSSHPGDFNLLSGCFSFPDLATPNSFCGSSIFDVGIKEMLLKLPCAQWPAGTYNTSMYSCTANPPVPLAKASVSAGVTIDVAMGLGSPTPSPTPAPLVSYSFTTGGAVSGPVPAYAEWQDTTGTALAGTPVVNSGRNPLNCDNYLYQGQCGVVGFQPISPAPAGCPTP